MYVIQKGLRFSHSLVIGSQRQSTAGLYNVLDTYHARGAFNRELVDRREAETTIYPETLAI
jgi:hypothetical protein